MTLRQRILMSNVLMMVVPVVCTLIAGILCAAVLFNVVFWGDGFDDSEDFEEASTAAAALADTTLSTKIGASDDDFTSRDFITLNRYLNKTGMQALIRNADTGRTVHVCGVLDEKDLQTAKTLAEMDDGTTLEQKGRIANITKLSVSSGTYNVFFYSDLRADAEYNDLKLGILISAGVLVLVVFVSTALATRILSRGIIHQFEAPLHSLERGLKAVARGDLSYRVTPPRDPEFAAAFNNFNNMAENLQRSTERLEQQDADRRQLLADIAHDLRSPLTSIQGYAEGLLDGIASTPQRQRRYLETIKERAEQISNLTDMLFEYSKLDLADYQPTLEPIALDTLVREAAQSFTAADESLRHVALDLANAEVQGDADLVNRILQNLFGNALKYGACEDGSVNLSITSERHQNDVVLSFSDNGPGVPAQDLERIFDPFYRADKSRTQTQEGSGMGLAFVQRAMQALGGSATAKSNEPSGLTVELVFKAASSSNLN